MATIPRSSRWACFGFIIAVLAAFLGTAFPSMARGDEGNYSTAKGLFPEFSLGPFGDSTSVSDEDPVSITASAAAEGDSTLRVRVVFELAPGWHIYSPTQPPGGPLPTKLTITSPSGLTVSKWAADREPKRSVSAQFKGVTIEEFGDGVTFSGRVQLPPGQTIDTLGPIQISVDALACLSGGACLPVNETVTANVTAAGVVEADDAGPAESTNPRFGISGGLGDSPSMDDILAAVESPADSESESPEAFRDQDSDGEAYVVQWTGSVNQATVMPGQTVQLSLTAKPDETFHVYPAAVDDADQSTNIVVTEKSGFKFGKPITKAPVSRSEPVPEMVVLYHPGDVTWTLPITIPLEMAPGKKTIRGGIAYQACTETSCLDARALRFETTLTVVDPNSMTTQVTAPVKFESAKRNDVLDQAATIDWVDTDQTAEPAASVDQSAAPSGSWAVLVQWLFTTFPGMLCLAFAGGVILNFMPCVLPVVGLKVMSFVQQAGEQRRRVLMLNLVYSLGILSVFALLAGLAVGFSFGWGEQFTFMKFRLALTVLLFALALSYLGVWEIPAPGFASGEASQKLGNQEGYTGAFFKGIFATLLATPCSGPLLGAILGATITLSPVQTIVVMMMVGVGMALPYLIIGLRPGLVSWLPKPGPWMETLKEFLAFLFLGTVAFFFYGFSDEHKVPVFITLIGVWFGCWIIGKVPNWAALQKRVLAWLGGCAAASLIGWTAFAALEQREELIDWQPYSEARLTQLQREGRTVVLDFTADWCVNCKVNERYALNTEPTREMLEELDAVAMVADWTDRDDPEIKEKLQELQSRSIPILAIYPGESPEQPIILRDLVSQSTVLKALEQAGPSVNRGNSFADGRPGLSSTIAPVASTTNSFDP